MRTLKEMHTRLVPAVKASAAAKAISTGVRLFGAMNGGRERLLVKMGGGCPRDASASPHAANDGSTNHDSANDDSAAPHRCNEIKTAPLTSLSFLVDVHMCDCVFCACVKEAVPLAKMYRLTDPADPYSVVNATQDWGASLWLASAASSSVDDKDVHDDPIRIALQRHFSLSNYQFEHVRAWVERVAESAYLRKLVFAKLNVVPANGRARHVQSWSDLVYRQWLYADVLAVLIGAPAPILSVQESAPPEFPFYLRSPYNFDSDSSTPDGMNWSFDTVRCLEQLIPANATWTFATFLNISITLPPGMLEEFTRPSLDERTSTVTLAECFPHSIEDGVHHMAGYARYFGRTVVQAELRHVIRQLGGGLVTTRTVREHVFGFQDPLLAMVLDKDDPRYDRHALLQNDASLNEEPLCRSSADVEDDYLACQQERKVAADGQTVARRYLRVPSTFHTGKDDFDRIGTVLEHRGQRSIKGIFRRTLELDDDAASQLTDGRQRGYSVGTAFPPFGKVTAGGGVALFIGPLLSTFVYKYRETVNDLHGIDLHRFQLPDSEWTAQRSNGNLLTTTHAGLLNLTDVKAFPLYITAPHNLGFEKRFPQFGGVSAASEQRHRSFIDIEPTTGKVMRARIQMQIAVSTNHCALDLNFPNAFKVGQTRRPIWFLQDVKLYSHSHARFSP